MRERECDNHDSRQSMVPTNSKYIAGFKLKPSAVPSRMVGHNSCWAKVGPHLSAVWGERDAFQVHGIV